MASTDKLLDTLRDLKKREGELYAFLEPLKKKFMETKSKTEKKSLKNKMNPGLEELKALVQKIDEVNASINAVAGPLGDISVNHSEEASGEPPLSPPHKTSGELPLDPPDKTAGEHPVDPPDNTAGEHLYCGCWWVVIY